MSFWSDTIGVLGGTIKNAVKSIPVVGDTLAGVVDPLVGLTEKYEQKKQLEDARGWSQYVTNQQNAFNSNEAALARAFNAEEAEKARQFSASEAEKARNLSRQWQLEDWERENAYNSPANQIKLMQDAGLNPLLFNESVSNASMSGAMSPSSPSGVAASASPASAAAQGQLAIINPSLQAAQTRLADAQAQKAESDIDLNKQHQERIKALLDGELKLQNSQYQVNLADAENKQMAAKLALKECEKIDAEIPNTRKQFEILCEQFHTLQNERKLTEKELEAFDQRLQMEFERILSEINKNHWDSQVSQKQISYLASQITHQNLENGILALDFDFANDEKVQGARKSVYLSTSAKETSDANVDLGYWRGQTGWSICRGMMRGAGQLFSGVASGGIKGLTTLIK